VWYLVKHKS